MNVWDVVKGQVTVGATVADAYRVSAFDDKGFTMTRLDSGKDVRVTRKMVETTVARLQAGETLKYQAAAPEGGISYTVAIVKGVEYALAGIMVRDESVARFKIATGAAARLQAAG